MQCLSDACPWEAQKRGEQKRRQVLLPCVRGRRISSQGSGKWKNPKLLLLPPCPSFWYERKMPLNLLFFCFCPIFLFSPLAILKTLFLETTWTIFIVSILVLKKLAILIVNVKKKYLLSQQNVLFQLVHIKHILSKKNSICLRRITITNMWAVPKCPSTDGQEEKMSCECVCVWYDMLFSSTTLTT